MRDWSATPARPQHAPIPHCPPIQTVFAAVATSNPVAGIPCISPLTTSKQKPRVMNPGPLNEFWVEAASDAKRDREPLERRRGETTCPELFAQSQTADGRPITRYVVLAQVRKQASPLTHHLQKSAARMVILPIGAKVIGQLRDPLGQK